MSSPAYAELVRFLGQRFDTIDQRFETIDRRFEAMDRRFDALDRKFDEFRAEVLEQRLRSSS